MLLTCTQGCVPVGAEGMPEGMNTEATMFCTVLPTAYAIRYDSMLTFRFWNTLEPSGWFTETVCWAVGLVPMGTNCCDVCQRNTVLPLLFGWFPGIVSKW